MTLHGPDVASHQGGVNWRAVASSGAGFGWTKATGGSWYVNPTFADNWRGMREAGLPRGAYHYAFESSGDPFPGQGPEAEADWFLQHVLGVEPLLHGDMLCLDIEEGPHDVDVAAWVLRWLTRVRDRVGFRPLVYTGRWFTESHNFAACPELGQYPLWLAAYQEAMPAPPEPWQRVVFWQFTDKGTVPGINGPCDLNEFNGSAELLPQYGKQEGGEVVVVTLPHYEWQYPSISQNDPWSCSCTSARWGLHAYGRRPTEGWIESTMLAEGVVSQDLGLLDATGAGLAAFLTRHYQEDGYLGEHDPSVSFDDVKAEAATLKHPLMIGGRAWGHWSGCRGYSVESDTLLLANPASGWKGVYQVMSRAQFDALGAFSLVRLRHPEAEGTVGPPGPTPQPPPAGAYYQPGQVGSGLIDAMKADGTEPALPSTWLPLGASPAVIEQCTGLNGRVYSWHIPTATLWTYPAAS